MALGVFPVFPVHGCRTHSAARTATALLSIGSVNRVTTLCTTTGSYVLQPDSDVCVYTPFVMARLWAGPVILRHTSDS